MTRAEWDQLTEAQRKQALADAETLLIMGRWRVPYPDPSPQTERDYYARGVLLGIVLGWSLSLVLVALGFILAVVLFGAQS